MTSELSLTESVSDLERHLIPHESWQEHKDKIKELAPDDIYNELFGEQSGPIGLGWVPEGYFVLMSGQGPFIAWAQWDS